MNFNQLNMLSIANIKVFCWLLLVLTRFNNASAVAAAKYYGRHNDIPDGLNSSEKYFHKTLDIWIEKLTSIAVSTTKENISDAPATNKTYMEIFWSNMPFYEEEIVTPAPVPEDDSILEQIKHFFQECWSEISVKTETYFKFLRSHLPYYVEEEENARPPPPDDSILSVFKFYWKKYWSEISVKTKTYFKLLRRYLPYYVEEEEKARPQPPDDSILSAFKFYWKKISSAAAEYFERICNYLSIPSEKTIIDQPPPLPPSEECTIEKAFRIFFPSIKSSNSSVTTKDVFQAVILTGGFGLSPYVSIVMLVYLTAIASGKIYDYYYEGDEEEYAENETVKFTDEELLEEYNDMPEFQTMFREWVTPK